MKKIITILVCISCIYMIVQPFRILFEGGQAISMLIPTVLIILYDMQFKNSSFIIATVYTILVLLLRSIGVEYFEEYLSQIVTMYFSICCMNHYIKTRDEFFAKSILITYFTCFVFMSFISIPQFYLFPDMTRQLVFAEHEGSRVESVFYWSIAYSSMHEIPLLLIPLVAFYKYNNKRSLRLLSIIAIAILLIAVMLGDATTPLLLSIIVLFILFGYNPRIPLSKNVRRLAFVSILLIIFLNKTFLISVLTTVQPYFEGTTNFSKIDDTIYQLKTGQVEEQTNLGQRELVYSISETTFWSHPFGIEKNKDKIGQHSFIIDHLAVMGLILIIPLVLLVILQYKTMVWRFKLFKFYYITTYIAFILMAYYKNFFLKIDAWFIVPLFLLILEKKINNNECNKVITSKNV